MNAEKIKHEITFPASQKFQCKFGWIPSLQHPLQMVGAREDRDRLNNIVVSNR